MSGFITLNTVNRALMRKGRRIEEVEEKDVEQDITAFVRLRTKTMRSFVTYYFVFTNKPNYFD